MDYWWSYKAFIVGRVRKKQPYNGTTEVWGLVFCGDRFHCGQVDLLHECMLVLYVVDFEVASHDVEECVQSFVLEPLVTNFVFHLCG
jgi:hypothetical protein